MARNRTENMVWSAVTDTEDLPGGLTAANQICARSYFDAVFATTIDIKLSAKDATVMNTPSFIGSVAWAPFILVYCVNFHRCLFTISCLPKSYENVVTHRAFVTV